VAHQTNPPGGDFVAKWSGVALDDRARAFRASGQLSSIASMVTTGGFRAISPDVSYPEAGSFVKYVLSRFTSAKIKTFFQRGRRDDSVATVEAAFDVCGVSLGQVETDWLRHLDATATLPARH